MFAKFCEFYEKKTAGYKTPISIFLKICRYKGNKTFFVEGHNSDPYSNSNGYFYILPTF